MLGKHCPCAPAPMPEFLTSVPLLKLTSGRSWREFTVSLVHCAEHRDVGTFQSFPDVGVWPQCLLLPGSGSGDLAQGVWRWHNARTALKTWVSPYSWLGVRPQASLLISMNF